MVALKKWFSNPDRIFEVYVNNSSVEFKGYFNERLERLKKFVWACFDLVVENSSMKFYEDNLFLYVGALTKLKKAKAVENLIVIDDNNVLLPKGLSEKALLAYVFLVELLFRGDYKSKGRVNEAKLSHAMFEFFDVLKDNFSQIDNNVRNGFGVGDVCDVYEAMIVVKNNYDIIYVD